MFDFQKVFEVLSKYSDTLLSLRIQHKQGQELKDYRVRLLLWNVVLVPMHYNMEVVQDFVQSLLCEAQWCNETQWATTGHSFTWLLSGTSPTSGTSGNSGTSGTSPPLLVVLFELVPLVGIVFD